eukprot:CAMPEP_0170991074 /NCGR_PEP_ID=MMETSP0736-20130129/8886_1 /TAXON_ID=186038 /ORGANISM="Fragilariopsis kerguelensis, Strain L26-C5" /LENGTH=796 /DNA_ID=CAMNT_0011416181 /DNA_START=106 /DNA_END=2497 /DNA_ORIENTATION=-
MISYTMLTAFVVVTAAVTATNPLHRLMPNKIVARQDGDSGRSIDKRLLALALADPSDGQSVFEATNGVHPYDLCDTDEDNLAYYMNIYFCNYQNEMLPYVVLPWYITDQETNGIRQDCPKTKEGCQTLDLEGLSLESCLELCGNTVGTGEACSNEIFCETGFFCNDGICSSCPKRSEECLSDDIGSVANKKNCLECDLKCQYLYWGDFLVDGESWWAYGMDSSPFYSIPGTAVAPLVDCSDLVLDKVEICPNANNSICLVHDIAAVEDSGGLAMVLYYSDTDYVSDDIPGDGFFSAPINIPAIQIAYNTGVALKENKLGSVANVTTYNHGTSCWVDQYCSSTVLCMDDDMYCKFTAPDQDEGIWCNPCPEDPVDCFFPEKGIPRVQNEIIEVAASVEFGASCKMCGEKITGFDFGVENPSDRCNFCPEEDVMYPDRNIPLFSTDDREIKCWQVQAFFSRIDVPKDSKNYQLAQQQNYICGCKGPGYGGANTQKKRNALVWMPRIAAILSILGSLFVLVDVLKDKQKRWLLFNLLMAQISLFDIIGSLAYAFTSAPTHSDYYIQGGIGNNNTCTVQGFFIQFSTISGFTNVSLAFYYYFVIKLGRTDTQLKKIRIWFLICPFVVGIIFAFAGIPFYDSVLLWCNNTGHWWPDIPIIVAILLATVVMAIVCLHVYKVYQASEQSRASGGGSIMLKLVFWQGFWYLMSFYMTWLPYVALQFLWSSNKSFGHYNFILYAGTVVPLQGVWNFFVYARNRQIKSFAARAYSNISSARLSIRSSFRWSGNNTSITQHDSTAGS